MANVGFRSVRCRIRVNEDAPLFGSLIQKSYYFHVRPRWVRPMGPSVDTLARSLSPPPQRDHYRMIYAMGLKLSSPASRSYPLLPVTPLCRIYSRIPLYLQFLPPFTAMRGSVWRAKENSCALLIVKKAGTKDCVWRIFFGPFARNSPARLFSQVESCSCAHMRRFANKIVARVCCRQLSAVVHHCEWTHLNFYTIREYEVSTYNYVKFLLKLKEIESIIGILHPFLRVLRTILAGISKFLCCTQRKLAMVLRAQKGIKNCCTFSKDDVSSCILRYFPRPAAFSGWYGWSIRNESSYFR